MQVY
jgi:hypothetical protein